MHVIIVGTGIAGLTSAIALRKAGHAVHLFEKTATATAFGAGVVIGNNASKVLDTFGFDYAKWRVNDSTVGIMFNGSTMDQIVTAFIDAEHEKMSGAKQRYAHRVDLQQGLLELATGNGKAGVPATVTYNANVVEYIPEEGTIVLETGYRQSADLVIAADGVHSLAPSYVLQAPVPLRDTGTTIVRFMLPTDAMVADPECSDMVQEGQFCFWIHPDRKRYLLQYPVRDNTEQNFGMYSIKDTSREADEQVMRFECDRSSLEKELEGFHPSILALVTKTKAILPVWKLEDRVPLKTWHRKRLLLVGDAAHPMLPNQGQGAGMCIEDAGALGLIFRDMLHASEAEICQRLQALEAVRRGRASVVQLVSRVPYYENAVELMHKELQDYLPKKALPGSGGSRDFKSWLFEYDLAEDCRKTMKEYIDEKS